MKNLLNSLTQKGLTIGSIESLTGGLFASELTSIGGASKAFKGSLITYSVEEKINLLGIDKTIIDEYGVVSSEVAFEMARLGRKVLNVDIAVSFTGNAGPTVEPGGMPVGRVYIGLATKEQVVTFEENFTGDRNEIRQKCVSKCIDYINKLIK